VRAETDSWLARERKTHGTYDVVVLAPLLRAHDDELPGRVGQLAERASSLLARGGVLVLCWRAREGATAGQLPKPRGLDCREVTAEVTQDDYARSRHPLRCLECRRTSGGPGRR
jgi:hypothetical protein